MSHSVGFILMFPHNLYFILSPIIHCNLYFIVMLSTFSAMVKKNQIRTDTFRKLGYCNIYVWEKKTQEIVPIDLRDVIDCDM